MEFVLFWLFFGGLTAVVAAAKGRNVPLWLGLGVVFGIFALAYVAFAPRIEKVRPSTEPTHLDGIKISR